MGELDQRQDGLRKVWLWACRFFVLVSVAAELLVFVAQIIVVRSSWQRERPRPLTSMLPLSTQMVNDVQRHGRLMGYGQARTEILTHRSCISAS